MNSINKTIATAQRSMQICNACRYCENLCAVFPAMTDMRDFDTPSLDYLANLCHQCGACFEACQYAPPHPFAVNVKQALSEQRADSYARVSPSRRIWTLVQRHGAIAGVALAALFSIILIIATAWTSSASLLVNHDGNFYALMPHGVMAFLGLVSFAFGVLGSILAAHRFQRDAGAKLDRVAWRGALRDATTLRYLGDDLCGAERLLLKRWQKHLHHFMTGGFLLCFVSTSLGTLAHYVLDSPAPYPWYSLTGLTGSVGGLAMLLGTTGLIGLKMYRPAQGDDATRAMDVGLVTLLWGVAATGLLLRFAGDSSVMGLVLMVHLGFVFAFFVTLPFSKMIHIPLRLLALARFHTRAGSHRLT